MLLLLLLSCLFVQVPQVAGVLSTFSIPASCADKKLSPGESDVDCGGPCLPCLGERKCRKAVDCFSKACDPRFRCAAYTGHAHPIVRVLGKNPDVVEFEKSANAPIDYSDAGAVCIDPKEGNLNGRIVAEIPDLDEVGAHLLHYKCTNKLGKTSEAVRTIITKHISRCH